MSMAFLEREINRFLASNADVDRALCIRGKWGTGKTHAWTEFYKAAVKRGTVSKERYACVSLFGINSLTDLKSAIVEESRKGEYLEKPSSLDSFADFWGAVGPLAKKNAKLLALIPWLKPAVETMLPMLFMSIRDQIVCLDDIERKGQSLTINDVLGLMSLLKMDRKCKIVIILNDEKLNERDDFERYLEKVVDKSITFAPTAEECAQIALKGNDRVSELIRDSVVKLDITNIRVINKIQMFARDMEPVVGKHGDRVLEAALVALSVFCWITFLPDEAPKAAFITDASNSRLARMMGNKKFSDDERKWSSILDSVGYLSFTDLDGAILDGLKNGIFDEETIEKLAEKAAENLRRGDLLRDFEASWSLYHDSLEVNQEEVVEEMDRSVRKAVSQVTVMNLDATVTLFKQLGYFERAKNLMAFYFDALPDDAPALQRPRSHPYNKAEDPDVVAALDAKLASRRDDRPFDLVVSELADQKWGDANIRRLAEADARDVIPALRRLSSVERRTLVDGAVSFRAMGTATGRAAYEHVRDAIYNVAAENVLNARRLSSLVGQFRSIDKGVVDERAD